MQKPTEFSNGKHTVKVIPGKDGTVTLRTSENPTAVFNSKTKIKGNEVTINGKKAEQLFREQGFQPTRKRM